MILPELSSSALLYLIDGHVPDIFDPDTIANTNLEAIVSLSSIKYTNSRPKQMT